MYPYVKTEQHRLLQETIRKFAQNELEPIAAEIDRESRFPIEVFRKLGEIGCLGVSVEEKYGGADGDFTSVCIVVEELAKVSPGFAMSVMVHLGMVEHGAFEFANEDQRARYLPRLCDGSAIGAFALTESSAGSDAAGLKTVAIKEGENYIINGSKTFITNPAADMDCIMVVTAQTGVRPDGKKEFSNFIVEKGQKGVSVGKHFDKLGMRCSPTSEVFFENVIVHESNLVGVPGKGLRQALTVLDYDRILASCLAIGIIDRVLQESIRYASTRHQFGLAIKEFQAIQFKIADMESDLRIARAMLAAALDNVHDRESLIMNAASLKLFSTSAAMKHTLEAIQIFGGYGYMKEYPVERFMRDNKLLEIGGGSSEILRLTIARKVLSKV